MLEHQSPVGGTQGSCRVNEFLILKAVELLSCKGRHSYPSCEHKCKQERRNNTNLLCQMELEQNRYDRERNAGKKIGDSVQNKVDITAIVALNSAVNRTY